MVQIFRIRGWFRQGLYVQKFTRELLATSRESALERVFSELGSKHKLRRNQIHIEGVVEINPEEVKDPRVLAMLE
jgi:large subunit ribosomal protein LX